MFLASKTTWPGSWLKISSTLTRPPPVVVVLKPTPLPPFVLTLTAFVTTPSEFTTSSGERPEKITTFASNGTD